MSPPSPSIPRCSQVETLRLCCTYQGRQKQPQQVLLYSDQLLQLNPEDAEAWRSRGFALVMLQRYQEARWDPAESTKMSH